MSFKRSAVYAKQLAEISQLQNHISHKYDYEEKQKERLKEIEETRKDDIDLAFILIETRAKTGAVRIFDWPKYYKNDMSIVFDPTIKEYILSKGFSYTYNTIEWLDAKDELK
jgi:hypothetical protein